MKLEKPPRFVHVVSHGPGCLDGVTAAVVVSRYYHGATIVPHFSSNTQINAVLLNVRCDSNEQHEVWITDISWTDPAVDRHLQQLIDHGVRIYWIDHHRSALQRYTAGEIGVRLTGQVLSEDYAASRLTYDYLRTRLRERGVSDDWFAAVERLVAMADDNDRWLHRISGSRTLALTVQCMHDLDAYEDLLNIDAEVTYTARMRDAERRARAEVARSFEVAARSRVVHAIHQRDLCVIAAVCDGHPSEIADAWGQSAHNTVFAFFDAQTQTVSLRRSPDCQVDLSRVAAHLGGGGHAAAAGCELLGLQRRLAEALADTLAAAIGHTLDRTGGV